MKKEKFIQKLHEKNNNIKHIKKLKPNEKMKIIGITGSHGKSSVAYLLNEYMKLLHLNTIMYSSIMIDSKNSKYVTGKSVEVPIKDEIMLYNALSESIESQCDYLILEINDATINKNICDDLDFDYKILTNIEPLENQMFDNYVDLKKRFISSGEHTLIMGLVSDETIKIYRELKNLNVITYTTEYFIENKNLKLSEVNYYLKPHNQKYHSFSGLQFDFMENEKKLYVKSNMNMPFHGLNLTCLISTLKTLNIFDEKIFKQFVKNIEIPGRDEIIKYKNGYVMISYTSVPQLEILKQYKNNNEISKITLITGASGNIFPTWDEVFLTQKYINQMEYDMRFAYNYALKYADEIIITTNDSGNNDIDELLFKQESLIKDKIKYKVIKSRYDAIVYALNKIESKEVIFISGRANRELICENNKIKRHLDKDVVMKQMNGGEQ